MRSAIRKHLTATFRREFERQYPQFALLKLGSGSTKIWGWSAAPDLHFFVVLHPFEREDIFALEIAWSEDGEFPWASIGDEFGLDKSTWRERLGILQKGEELLWDAAPEVKAARQANLDAMLRGERTTSHPPPPPVDVAIARIAALVDDCLLKFRELGLPVLIQLAEHRGLPDMPS